MTILLQYREKTTSIRLACGFREMRVGNGRGSLWFIAASAAILLLAGIVAALWATNGPRDPLPGANQPAASILSGARPGSAAAIQPLTGPWIVAVQPGHWESDLLPAELSRLRRDTGAQWGNLYEVNINRAVVASLISMIEAQGWRAILVPATVPPGLRADAFVAVHADSSTDTSRRGWKLAPPWRSSPAGRTLASALSASFAAAPGLVQDSGGVTVNMRGYYAFNYRRFNDSISPYTPAVIIEMGFISNSEDRRLLASDPSFFAGIILRGLQGYFKDRKRSETADLFPMELPWVAAAAEGAVVRGAPDANSAALWRIAPGTAMMPVDASGDWYEVFVRSHWATGWVSKNDLVETSDPHWPMPGEHR